MTDEEIAQEVRIRVAKGVEILDRKFPGWADNIDLDSFKMTNYCGCVLGQVGKNCGLHYTEMAEELAGARNGAIIEKFTEDFGFDAFGRFPEANTVYEALHAEWKRIIVERQNVTK